MSTGDSKLDQDLEALINTIRETETYQNYRAAQQKVAKDPALQARIDAFRLRNFEMQKKYQGNELLEKTDDFSREYEAFRENPVVDEFLGAELAFCRMIQNMDDVLVKELDFH